MNRSLQRGFTAIELIQVLAFLAFWGLVIAVVVHFIIKFW